MRRGEGACLVCGGALLYVEKAEEMECSFCHKKELSRAKCKEGHYVCDECHAKKGVEAIMGYCSKTRLKDPVSMLSEMMEDPYVYMHGPEHHIMVGAALITAYYNAGGEVCLEEALSEMKERGGSYPGGSCGFWGCCGAAVSVGMCTSILTKSTPLSGKSWGIINRATGRVLDAIGELGGPRCCKRNSFTAVKVAAELFEEHFGIRLEAPDAIRCSYSEENKQCIRRACPYYGASCESKALCGAVDGTDS